MVKRTLSVLFVVAIMAGAMGFPAAAQDSKMKMESTMTDSKKSKMSMMGKKEDDNTTWHS